MSQTHDLLYGCNKFTILALWIVAQNVHIEAGALPDHRLADAAGPDYSHGFAADLVSQKRQKRMPPAPASFPHHCLAVPKAARHGSHHEKSKFGGSLGQDFRGVGKW